MFYTYIIIDPVKNEPFYIGKGSKYRVRRHIRNSPNKHVNTRIKKLRKNGSEPIIKKIECSSEQIAFDLEKGLIKLIGRRDLNKGPLFNFTDGGEGTAGKKRPDLSERNKLSRGKPSWNKGLKWSEKTKDKMRKPKSEEHKKKLSIAKKGQGLGKIWITNGVKSILYSSLEIPEGYIRGRHHNVGRPKKYE